MKLEQQDIANLAKVRVVRNHFKGLGNSNDDMVLHLWDLTEAYHDSPVGGRDPNNLTIHNLCMTGKLPPGLTLDDIFQTLKAEVAELVDFATGDLGLYRLDSGKRTDQPTHPITKTHVYRGFSEEDTMEVT